LPEVGIACPLPSPPDALAVAGAQVRCFCSSCCQPDQQTAAETASEETVGVVMGPTEFERHAGAEMPWNWDKMMPATIKFLLMKL